MNAQMLLQSFAGGDEEKTYIDDVFSTYLYTGNGSTQTINNGIDLAGEGGLVWIKSRSAPTNHFLFDTARGPLNEINSNTTDGQASLANSLTGFSTNGFTVGSAAGINNNSATYASWIFRKAPKFFDIVTYTGNGSYSRLMSHALAVAPGIIFVKRVDSSGDWFAYHRYLGYSNNIRLNTTAGYVGWTNGDYPWGGPAGGRDASETNFMVGGANTNANGAQYVAYLWAHDPSEDGIVQCGNFTTDASGNATVDLGWEPQYLLFKSSSAEGSWYLVDSTRGFPASSAGSRNLSPNQSSAEAELRGQPFPTSTGFQINLNYYGANKTHIYLAIRRPNKPPTSGTEVYNAIVRSGTGAAATVTGVGFPPDLAIGSKRSANLYSIGWIDRLRGSVAWLGSVGSNAENPSNPDQITSFDMSGVTLGADINRQSFNFSGASYINYFFRRTPGFFDVVCDTGTGAAHAVAHNLTVAPELIIRKSRSANTQWEWWHSALTATEKLVLNSTAGKATDATAFGTLPTATHFYVGSSSNTNASAATYVTYLFATCPGVSKVGYYTGNGTSLTVECGFSTGARFILAKSIDDAGDSFIWDSARGIVAANDPHLSLNTIAAEVTTDDSVDPYAGGFIVNQNTATNINVNGKRYAYLAIA